MRRLKSKRVLIVVGGFLLMLLAAGTVAWRYQMLPLNTAAKEEKPAEEPSTFGVGFPVKEETINLTDTNPPRYLKIEVVLEVAGGKAAKPPDSAAYKKAQEQVREELSRQSPAIEDTLIMTLSSKKSADLLTTAGKERVKHELIERIQPLVGERKLTNVYFRQFIIQ